MAASPGRARGEGSELARPEVASARAGAFPANTERHKLRGRNQKHAQLLMTLCIGP